MPIRVGVSRFGHLRTFLDYIGADRLHIGSSIAQRRDQLRRQRTLGMTADYFGNLFRRFDSVALNPFFIQSPKYDAFDGVLRRLRNSLRQWRRLGGTDECRNDPILVCPSELSKPLA